MTREELRALAALDAFGLLDEYETALYTRSFHHAPVAVQDEIIALQAELVSDETLLPAVTPPSELRAKVLQAVARAVEATDTQLRPLATIGGGNRRMVPPVQPAQRHVMVGPSHYWRAAAFVLIGAIAVMSYFWSEVYRQNNRFTKWALDSETDRLITELGSEIGPTLENFLRDHESTRVTLNSTDAEDLDDYATVWMSQEDDRAIVIISGLQISESEYSLVVRDATGKSETLARFRQERPRATHRITVSALARAENVTWEITNAAGVVMLRSS
jgi:hypothetical protein